jgi:hypothetical protein
VEADFTIPPAKESDGGEIRGVCSIVGQTGEDDVCSLVSALASRVASGPISIKISKVRHLMRKMNLVEEGKFNMVSTPYRYSFYLEIHYSRSEPKVPGLEETHP